MPQLKLGLYSKNDSFYDPKTNLYITPSNPMEIVNYDDNTDLSNIAKAVFSQCPTLILYEGKLPQKAVDAYKASYTNLGQKIFDRADNVNAKVAPVVTCPDHGGVPGDDCDCPGENIARGTVKESEKDLITVKEVDDEEVVDLEADEKPKAKNKKK